MTPSSATQTGYRAAFGLEAPEQLPRHCVLGANETLVSSLEDCVILRHGKKVTAPACTDAPERDSGFGVYREDRSVMSIDFCQWVEKRENAVLLGVTRKRGPTLRLSLHEVMSPVRECGYCHPGRKRGHYWKPKNTLPTATAAEHNTTLSVR